MEYNLSNVEYASIGKRAIAFFIDDIIVSFLYIIIFYDQIIKLKSQDEMVAFIVEYSWVLLLLKVIYHSFFIAYNGATIGKYFAKIKAIDEDSGKNLTWSRSILRAIVREIGESFFYFTFWFAFVDSKRQTLHDKISKCVVINV